MQEIGPAHFGLSYFLASVEFFFKSFVQQFMFVIPYAVGSLYIFCLFRGTVNLVCVKKPQNFQFEK